MVKAEPSSYFFGAAGAGGFCDVFDGADCCADCCADDGCCADGCADDCATDLVAANPTTQTEAKLSMIKPFLMLFMIKTLLFF